jgi:hypothetical protein
MRSGLDGGISSYSLFQQCQPWDTCNPQVMAYSVNALPPSGVQPIDRFPNGRTYDIQPCIADDVYGGLWQGAFFDNVDDPMFPPIAPPGMISGGIELTKDDLTQCQIDESGGFGGDDTILQFVYPYQRLIEPRVGVPAPWISGDTAPPFEVRSGVHATALTFAQICAGQDGLVFQPPGAVGLGMGECPDAGDSMIYPNGVMTSWRVAMGQESCVCGGGTFADLYQANLVPCTTPDRKAKG